MSDLSPIEDVLGRLDGVKKDGTGWSARCPCRNDDHNPSLHIGLGEDDRVLMTCHRGGGCTLDEICTALQMTVADLHTVRLGKQDDRPAPKPVKRSPAPVTKAPRDKLTLTDAWDYYSPDGTLAFQKRRFVNQDGKKTFRQRRPDGRGGWIANLGDTPHYLYRTPQIRAAISNGDTIWVVEGEKDADTLVAAHYEATTMPGGAGKWRDLHTETLAGAYQVVVVADNDVPGRAHAVQVVETLRAAGLPVELLVPPDGFKDVTDMIEAGLSLNDLAPEDVSNLTVAETTVFEGPDEFLEHLSNLTVEETRPEFESEEGGDVSNVTVAETDDWEGLADALHVVLLDGGLSERQRVVKASRLLERFLPGDEVLPLEVLSWARFVEGVDDPYDWLIPGVLERGERVIVVAEEGAGKTFLMRQVALCAAAGVHPFTKSRMPVVKTLSVDLENPERIIRRTSKDIVSSIRLFTKEVPDADLVIRPSGLNLLKAPDRQFLEAAIEASQPDLVCMGPLYKSFVDPGGRTSEAIAVEIARYLDELRDEYKISWWLEHHAPLGDSMRSRDLRPFGSAVWSRWPEFGLALHHDPTVPDDYIYEVKHFRGARDARQWPTRMKRGGKGNLPFEVLEFLRTP